jgi:hypothetical protein
MEEALPPSKGGTSFFDRARRPCVYQVEVGFSFYYPPENADSYAARIPPLPRGARGDSLGFARLLPHSPQTENHKRELTFACMPPDARAESLQNMLWVVESLSKWRGARGVRAQTDNVHCFLFASPYTFR